MDSLIKNILFNLGGNQSVSSSALLIVFVIWSFLWKGVALWNAAKHEEKYWYVALLVLNTIGILEILYLFVFSKHKLDINKVKKFIESRT